MPTNDNVVTVIANPTITLVPIGTPSGGGEGGAVDSVAGRTGIVVLTKSDVGLSNVDNTSDDNKPVSTAQATSIASAITTASNNSTPVAHATNTSNPHSVTKTQVGLSNVDNTSDVNKPVSTAQTTAINAAITAQNLAATYAPIAKGVTNGDSHNHLGGDGAQIAYSSLSGTPTLGGAASLNVGTTAGTVAAGDDARFSGGGGGGETVASIGALIAGAVAKAVPVSADSFGISDSADGGELKELTFGNMLEAIYKAGVPRRLWFGGQTFLVPPGDGGSNGLYVTGVGTGAFTLHATIPEGFMPPHLWIYLPANVGASGNPEGWHYATMWSVTAGIIYADRYDSTSGVMPVYPSSPTPLVCTVAERITSTNVEVQAFQVPFNAVEMMGKNGTINSRFYMGGSALAGNKSVYLRAGTNELFKYSVTTSPVVEAQMMIAAQGATDKQVCTRNSTSVPGAATTTVYAGVFKNIDLTAETTLSMSIKTSTSVDSCWFMCKELFSVFGD